MAYDENDRSKALVFVDANLLLGNSLRQSILQTIQRMNEALVPGISPHFLFRWFKIKEIPPGP